MAGTFNGGVALISLDDEKMVSYNEKVHCFYVSSLANLTKFEDKYVVSISADQCIVWNVNESFDEVMRIPLNFTMEGDYKWWEVLEIKGY